MTMPRLRPAAGVVLSDGADQILVMRRSGEGTWGIPGGGVEPGESWADAALRECREETGWVARVDGLLGIYSEPSTQVHISADGSVQHLVGVVFRATAVDRVGDPDGETAELRWVTADTLPSPIFPPDAPVLRDAFDSALVGPVIR